MILILVGLYYSTWPRVVYRDSFSFDGAGIVEKRFTIIGIREHLRIIAKIETMGILNITILHGDKQVYTYRIIGKGTYTIDAIVSGISSGNYTIQYSALVSYEIQIQIIAYNGFFATLPTLP